MLNRKGSLKLAAVILTAFAVFGGRAYAGGADPLTVNVIDQNGNGLASALVVALHFKNGNPDPADSPIAIAAANGAATFSQGNGNGLVDTDQYTIVATSQGYTPTIAQQFNAAPTQVVATPSLPPTPPVIQIRQSGGLGEIDVPFTGITDG